jgi:hypothetical protein
MLRNIGLLGNRRQPDLGMHGRWKDEGQHASQAADSKPVAESSVPGRLGTEPWPDRWRSENEAQARWRMWCGTIGEEDRERCAGMRALRGGSVISFGFSLVDKKTNNRQKQGRVDIG